MDSMSTHLRRALESECATGVDEAVDANRPEDLDVLRAMVRGDVDVTRSWRQSAIQILGRWRDTGSVPAIRRLLPGFTERERINAVAALGRIGGADAEVAVLELTEDASPDVRRFAAYALAELGTPIALNRLRNLRRVDPEEFVRTAAARSLVGRD